MKQVLKITLVSAVIAIVLDLLAWMTNGCSDLFFVVFHGRVPF